MDKDLNSLRYSCLDNPMDGGAWWAAVHGVAQSDTTEAMQQQQGLELRQTSWDGEWQGVPVCCILWGHKESDMTGQMNNNKN